jgi:hypothetical protein
VQHWLLVRGRGERRLDASVAPDELSAHSSTRAPRIRAGDRALLYAAGWQVVFAVADVVSDPVEDPARTRWRWRFGIRPELALADLREARSRPRSSPRDTTTPPSGSWHGREASSARAENGAWHV